jgi:hypothetical protein
LVSILSTVTRIDGNNIQIEANVVQLKTQAPTTQANIELFDPPLATGMASIPLVTQEKEDDSRMPQPNKHSNDPNIPQQSNRNVLIKLGSVPSLHEFNTWRLIFGEAAHPCIFFL